MRVAFKKSKRGKRDSNPDEHAVFYDGNAIYNNTTAMPVRVIEESDRSFEGARAVFASLYPRLEVRVTRVFEVVPVAKSP